MSSLKLELLTETMEYLRPELRETRTAEETAESIIPDSCPDITEILHTGGQCFLRGWEVSEGSATVSAGVSAMVLAQPEGRMAPEVIEAYLPISLRFDGEQLKPGMIASPKVTLRRLDSHMVNPRKVQVRAVVSVSMTVWSECREEHPVDAASDNVELLKETEVLKLLTACGEKTYSVEDTVRLSPEGTGVRLADYQISISHSDARLTGTRAVLKGDLELQVLYLNEDLELTRGTASLPFSQYIDLGDCRESDELLLTTCLTGADLEFSADGGGLNVTLQLLSRAEVWAKQETVVLRDLYALDGQAVPEWREWGYESLLDRQYFSPVGHGTLNLAGEACYTTCHPGEITHTRNGENTEFNIPVKVQVVVRNGQTLSGGTVRINLTCGTRAAAGCRFEVQTEGLRAEASDGVDGMDVKVTGTVCVRTYGQQEIREITGGEISETEPEPNRPGLIIRRPKPRETLWEIAKQYRTTVDAIRQANSLTGEPGTDALLLIPRR